MVDFISRLIFQDDFSATAKKYEQSTDEVVKSTESAGRAVEHASSKVGKLKSALSGIRGTHKTEVKAVGLGTVDKNIGTIQTQIERLTNKPVSITAQAKLTRNDIKLARSEIKELKAQLKDLTGQKYDINLDVNGTQVSTLGSKIKGGAGMALSVAGGSLLAGGVGAAVMGVGSGIGSAVGQMWSGGNERQQYLSSMTHFMGSEQGARDMMAWANENARTTQFSSGEVLAAASRAIQVADGNAAEAQRFTQLAEDMASLTPGKTVMDALEALADAKQKDPFGVRKMELLRLIPSYDTMAA